MCLVAGQFTTLIPLFTTNIDVVISFTLRTTLSSNHVVIRVVDVVAKDIVFSVCVSLRFLNFVFCFVCVQFVFRLLSV